MKKSYQNNLLTLLGEISHASASHSIPFVCANRLAWDVLKFGAYHDSTHDAFIAICSEDAERLEQALGVNSHRCFESYQDKGMGVLRYVDNGSFYYDLLDTRPIRKPGLAVDILLLDFSQSQHCKYIFDGKEFDFSKSDFFPASQEKEFEGILLPLPANVDKYFSALISQKWKTSTYTGSIHRERKEALCDPSLPFEVALETPFFSQILFDKKFKQRKVFDYIQKKIQPVEQKANRYDRMRRLTARRFHHWEQIYPKFELLQACSKEERRTILDPYLKDIYRYVSKYQLGLYIDDIVDALARPYIIEEKGDGFYKRYESLIPKSHKIPSLESQLKSDQVDHPLFY